VYLIQLLLPVRDNAGEPYPKDHYDGLARRLTERFGGVTAYTRAPATGLWETASGETVRDQVVVYEVMADELDREYWGRVRLELEARFAQEELVIRAQHTERL
jgi:hypothetical protein